jgi:hypothetical protein
MTLLAQALPTTPASAPEETTPEPGAFGPAAPDADDPRSAQSGELAAQPSQEANLAGAAPLPQSHHPLHKRHYRRHTKTFWAPLMLMLGGIELAFLLMIHARSSVVKQEKAQLAQSIQSGAEEREVLQAKAFKLKGVLDERVRTRLPGLRAVEFDRVIPLEEGPLKNIMFTQAGLDQDQDTEYRIVLSNPNATPARLQVEILLFNQAGIQTGRALVGKGSQNAPAPINLDGNETRAYSDKMETGEGHQGPTYFLARVARPHR